MNAAAFASLVELRTKAASVLPFLFGLAYARRNFGSFDASNSLLMLASLLCVDMGTTALNNYADWKRARRKEGYNYEVHNAVVAFRLRERTVKAVLTALFAGAAVFGLVLAHRTGPGTLLLGAAAFAVGLSYSAGPLPISRTPFGELFSGATMGFLIPLIAVHVNAPEGALFSLELSWPEAFLRLELAALFRLALASAPLVCGIAGIMLANNLCDMEADEGEGRLTLPLALGGRSVGAERIARGRRRALRLFAVLELFFPAPLAAAVLAGGLPLPSLLALAAVPAVLRGVRGFSRTQTKKETFVLSVRNFLLVAGLLAAGTAAGIAVGM